jgi:hypothetical protein
VLHRELPGGGFVAIDVAARRSLLGRRRFDGWIVVERRSGRVGAGSAPVIARAWDKSMEGVIQQLLPAALSNVAIGAALLRRPRGRDRITPTRTSGFRRHEIRHSLTEKVERLG